MRIVDPRDPLTVSDTSSYGSAAIAAVASIVSADQLLDGSDRPGLEPIETEAKRGPKGNAGDRFARAFGDRGVAIMPTPLPG